LFQDKCPAYAMASWRESNKARNVHRESQEDRIQRLPDKTPEDEAKVLANLPIDVSIRTIH